MAFLSVHALDAGAMVYARLYMNAARVAQGCWLHGCSWTGPLESRHASKNMRLWFSHGCAAECACSCMGATMLGPQVLLAAVTDIGRRSSARKGENPPMTRAITQRLHLFTVFRLYCREGGKSATA